MNEDKSTRYQRLQRRVSVASLIWSTILLVAVVASGAAVALRQLVETVTGGQSLLPSIALYVAVIVLLHEAGAIPLGFYGGFILERRYGLSTQTARRWLIDQCKAVAITFVVGTVAAVAVYSTIRWSAQWWWLLSGALFSLFLALLANLAPVVLLPLFYTIKPLANEGLRARLLLLAERAGARVLGAYEWGLGERSRKANAALTGLGSTRRILVSDTMLAAYSEDEIEVVLAHELAHHVYGDIWKGLVLEGALMLAGFLVAAQVLTKLGPDAGLRDPADIAGIPLLTLAAGAVSLVMVPVAHAVSRAHERRADRFALELTRNPAAFVSAMRRLGAQNLAEEHPSKLVQWLFQSHPPLHERITSANDFSRPTTQA